MHGHCSGRALQSIRKLEFDTRLATLIRICGGICCRDYASDSRLHNRCSAPSCLSKREALATQSPKTCIARGRLHPIVPVLLTLHVTLVLEWNTRACRFPSV